MKRLLGTFQTLAIADEKLKEAGLLPEGVGRSLQDISLQEQHDAGLSRAAAIEAIEDEGFTQTHFTSSRGTKVCWRPKPNNSVMLILPHGNFRKWIRSQNRAHLITVISYRYGTNVLYVNYWLIVQPWHIHNRHVLY